MSKVAASLAQSEISRYIRTMLIQVQNGLPPMRGESVQTLVRGRGVVEVVEGWQPLAPGLAERVRLVMSQQERSGRRRWN